MYKNPPPICSFDALPANSHAAPSLPLTLKISSILSLPSSMISFTPTAQVCGFSSYPRPYFEQIVEFAPSATITTSALISSPPAITPQTLPSSLIRSSTLMPAIIEAPASSAFSPSHASNLTLKTEYDRSALFSLGFRAYSIVTLSSAVINDSFSRVISLSIGAISAKFGNTGSMLCA